MQFLNSVSKRKLPRRQGFDYSTPTAYFVTLCTLDKRCILGEGDACAVRLNQLGQLVRDCWTALPNSFAQVVLDSYVVMPNHFHAIVWLNTNTNNRADLAPLSLSDLMRQFKGVNAYKARAGALWNSGQIWQRSFHDHIVRDNEDLQRIRQYIADNPIKWSVDEYFR